MTRAELSALIDRRNAANDNSLPDTRSGVIDIQKVRAYLLKVRAHALQQTWMHETSIASFCGAAGLVVIRGKSATITESGLQAIA